MRKNQLTYDPFRKSVTIERAAAILDKSRYFVYDLISAGKLEKVKIGRSSYVTLKSLEEVQTPK